MNELLVKSLYDLYGKYPLISTDTRTLKNNSLFFALKGDRFNANEFAEEALKATCKYAIIDDASFKKDERYILVPDVLLALQELAMHHRKQLSIPVIGITGSNGKTTTKELVSAVLSKKFRVASTQGNLNNHIGVPLTILTISRKDELAVIEMGANHIGEIKQLCNLTRPTHGIITNIGKAHLEGFGGYEGVIKAKSELYDFLRENEGTAFVNSEDGLLMKLSASLKRFTYGKANADTCGTFLGLNPYVYFSWGIRNNKNTVEVQSKLIGKYNLDNILASIATGVFFDVPVNDINRAVETFVPSMNRSEIITKGSITIIMDAYNANPTSMRAAIENFSSMKGDKKMLILGDMLELGAASISEHQEIITLLKEKKLADVVLIGEIFFTCNNTINATRFPTAEKAAEWLKCKSFRDHTLLIKGSRGIKLEKVLPIIQE